MSKSITQDMAYRQSLMKYAEKYGVSRASLPISIRWFSAGGGGEITVAEAMRRLDLKPSTFYRKVRKEAG